MSTIKSVEQLDIREKVAIAKEYDLSDPNVMTHVCSVLKIESPAVLEAGIGLLNDGFGVDSVTIDRRPYRKLFDPAIVNAAVATAKATPSHTNKRHDSTLPPQTATKRVKPKSKRGRKGDKTISAFRDIPSTPTMVTEFITQHGISLHVLRQFKRFDAYTDPTHELFNPNFGTVHVKKDRNTGLLMVWRENQTESPQPPDCVATA